eukprot:TRINITY_DN3506_c0_g1_i2.p1 TRINITY_DN3506_c0_g1~~TRINITY_DN3506_c0_g1_i2.p1  ORF type:complete len:177 (-),score=60.60 TRINITY_DN3506_c0_g1_i2:130-660(-)
MDSPPKGRRGRLITNAMWRNILLQAIYQLAVLGTLRWMGPSLLGYDETQADGKLRLNTFIFNTFVLCQLMNEVNSREIERLDVFSTFFSNGIFLFILGSTFIVQVAMVQFGGHIASTCPLSLHEWLLCLAPGLVSLPLAILIKLIPVPSDGESADWCEVEEQEAAAAMADRTEGRA